MDSNNKIAVAAAATTTAAAATDTRKRARPNKKKTTIGVVTTTTTTTTKPTTKPVPSKPKNENTKPKHSNELAIKMFNLHTQFDYLEFFKETHKHTFEASERTYNDEVSKKTQICRICGYVQK